MPYYCYPMTPNLPPPPSPDSSAIDPRIDVDNASGLRSPTSPHSKFSQHCATQEKSVCFVDSIAGPVYSYGTSRRRPPSSRPLFTSVPLSVRRLQPIFSLSLR